LSRILGAQAAISHHIMTAVTGLVIHLVHRIHCSPDVQCAMPYRRVVGVGIFSNVWPPLMTAQKGIALLILPDVSAGYPSIFLPASLAQQPQKIAAGQHMIWTVCQDFRIWAQVEAEEDTASSTPMMKPSVGPTTLTWHGF
jgi:hypothetical protein